MASEIVRNVNRGKNSERMRVIRAQRKSLANNDDIPMQGRIFENLPSATFMLELENGHKLPSLIRGKMRKNCITILPGNKVSAELTQYNRAKSRTEFRS